MSKHYCNSVYFLQIIISLKIIAIPVSYNIFRKYRVFFFFVSRKSRSWKIIELYTVDNHMHRNNEAATKMYVVPKLQGGSNLLLGPNTRLSAQPYRFLQQLALLNQIWVHLPDLHQSQPADTRLWWKKVQCLWQDQARITHSSCSKDPTSLMTFTVGS